MRRTSFIVAVGLFAAAAALAAWAGPADPRMNEPIAAPPLSCGNGIPGGVNCLVSKKDRKEAQTAFQRGQKFQDHHQLTDALDQFDEASKLVPQDAKFLTARELVKGQLVFTHMENGNRLLASDARLAAAGEFRAALELDPDNQFAQERFAEATRVTPSLLPTHAPSRLEDLGEIRLQPKVDKATFHFIGDTHGLFNVLATSFGVSAQFDDTVKNRDVRFTVDDVDFFTALQLACQISKCMWTALGPHQIFIADDTPTNHKTFDHMSLATITMPPHSNPAEGQEFLNLLRTMFDIRFIAAGQTANVLEIRAPQRTLDAATQLLAQLDNQKPQVMLEIRIYDIDHQFTRDIGLHVPDTFNLFNIPVAAIAAALGGQNINQLVNQLVSSGGVNQAGNTALSGLLAQLQSQFSSLFAQPLATFGGGLTFSGLSLDHLTTALSLNESWARNLEDAQVRAGQSSDATFHVGSRYPILNASFAPVFNSPQIAQVLGNQTFVPPAPSISYEDIGLNIKAKPVVHLSGTIGLDLDVQVRSLTGQMNNGVPVISNREFKGAINLKDGEPAVVAGQVSRMDMISMSGIPGIASIAGLNAIGTDNSKQQEEDELMIVITPHILATVTPQTPEIWLTEK
jgi:general secretion pathway protein D